MNYAMVSEKTNTAERATKFEKTTEYERAKAKEKTTRRERASETEKTTERERARRLEKTTKHERATVEEKTIPKERANGIEKTNKKERANDEEKTSGSERATGKEKTTCAKRATTKEKTNERERAMAKEKTIKEDKMEIKLEELLSIVGGKTSNPFSDKIGTNVFIRTVTYHYIGKVERTIGDFVELSNSAWIADSGRFADALNAEDFSEVEPYPRNVRINSSAVVDFTELSVLRTDQK